MAACERNRHGQSGGRRATPPRRESVAGKASVGGGGREGGGGQVRRPAGNQGVYGGEDFLGFFVLPTVTLGPGPTTPPPLAPGTGKEAPVGNETLKEVQR